MSKKSVYIKLPMPPSVNCMYMLARGRQGVVLTPQTRAYYEEVRSQLDGHSERNGVFMGRLHTRCVFHESDKKRRDINNLTKALFDSLEGIIYHDDSQIDVSVLERGDLWEVPGVEVWVWEYADTDDRQTLDAVREARRQRAAQKKLDRAIASLGCKRLKINEG